MSIQAVAAVLDHSEATGNDRLILIVIANHVADRQGRLIAWPSQEKIASEARCSMSTVKRSIKALVEMGELEIVSRGGRRGDGSAHASEYRVLIDPQGVKLTPWEEPQGVTGDPPTVLPPQDLAPLGHEDESETFSSERSFGSSTTVAVEVPAREPSEGERYSEQLCLLLRAKLVANGVRPPVVTKAWLDAARRLIDIDGQSPYAVERCIEWTCAHEFWSTNIHSMPTLRKQWDKLAAQARREKRNGGMGPRYNDAMDSLVEARQRILAGGRL